MIGPTKVNPYWRDARFNQAYDVDFHPTLADIAQHERNVELQRQLDIDACRRTIEELERR